MLVQSWQIWLQQWLTQLEQRMARAELGANANANAKPPFVKSARSANSHR